MDAVSIMTLIFSGLTLVVSLVTAVLAYRLEKQKKKIERLEKYYTISLENLQACYEIEEYLAQRIGKSRKQFQRELGKWMINKNIDLKRDYYRPSFFKNELTYLRK